MSVVFVLTPTHAKRKAETVGKRRWLWAERTRVLQLWQIIALLLPSSSPFASQRLDNPTSTIVSNRPHPGTFLLTLACLLLCVRQDALRSRTDGGLRV
jgi:hypothetical protein